MPENQNQDAYPPSEDTFFLLETIIKEAYYYKHSYLIEVGTGSGYILHELLSRHPNAQGLGIDLSFLAIKHASSLLHSDVNTSKQSTFLVTNLLDAIKPSSLYNPLIIFNPPYLPENPEIDPLLPKHEVIQYTGGPQGHETIMTFMNSLLSLPCARAYALFSDRALPLKDFLQLIPSTLPITISSKTSWFYETLYTIRVDPQCQK